MKYGITAKQLTEQTKLAVIQTDSVGLFDDSLPDPPDNVVEWEELPEAFREHVANQFERGVAHELSEMGNRHGRAERLLTARDEEKHQQHQAYLARQARRARQVRR